MKLRRTIKIFLYLAAFLLPCAWLITTTSGLNAVLTMATIFSPIPFEYAQVNGKLLGQPIEIRDLAITYDGKALEVGLLTIDWQQGNLAAANVRGLDKFLPHAKDLSYQKILLDQVVAHLDIKDQKQVISIQAHGQSFTAPLRSNIRLIHSDKLWDIQHVLIEIGKNSINLQQYQEDQYKWNLVVNQPQVIFAKAKGAIIGNGSMQNLHSTPKISANIQAKTFTLNDYQIHNLHAVVDLLLQPSAPLKANITAADVIVNQHSIKDLKIQVAGDLDQHTINCSTIYKQELLNISATASLMHKIWDVHKLQLKYKHENLDGTAKYDFKQHNGNIAVHGKLLSFPSKALLTIQDPEKLNFQLEMQSGPQNALLAKINVNQRNLDGDIRITADDIAFLMQWLPDVTRLKGKFNARLSVTGTLDKPDLTSEAHLTEVTATLPGLGIKIKPLELHVRGDKSGKFMLQGKGKMRRGPGEFTLSGSIEPFNPEMPNAFKITGANIEFINNELAHLIASNNLNIHYAKAQQSLDITGDIEIHQGKITIADKRQQTVKSKDVIFVNEAQVKPKKLITINPNLNVRIADGVHFTGFSLDADITGKLNISHRHEAMYAAGRVTIKQGSFQLPGQKLAINHGRFLYPPGTLLSNPVLDIKMLGISHEPETTNDPKHDLEVIVQGTAQKPVISESGLKGNQDRALSQILQTGSGVIAKNILQDKLKISEIGLRSRDEHEIDFFDDPSKDKSSLKNKDIVIGRALGRKFYVQYLQSISEANKRVRLQYALNDIWAIGVESGTQGGGADLSFTIEQD